MALASPRLAPEVYADARHRAEALRRAAFDTALDGLARFLAWALRPRALPAVARVAQPGGVAKRR